MEHNQDQEPNPNQEPGPTPPESQHGEVKMSKPKVLPPPGLGANSAGGSPPPYEYQRGRKPQAEDKKRKSFLGGLVLIMVLVFIFIGGGIIFTALVGGGSARSGGFGGGLTGDRIGVVRIEGPIMPGEQYEHWMTAIRDLGDDSRIKGLILRIDSPGGAVGTTQEIYEAISRIKIERGIPVFASMGNIAASGGYYVSAVCDEIYALKGTLTGSIGTIFEVTNFSDLAEKVGVEVEYIKSGRFKDAGSPFRDMNDNEKYIFQLAIEDSYDQFVEDIIAHRGEQIQHAAENLPAQDWEKFLFTTQVDTPVEAEDFLRQVGDGRVYTGQQALRLGLVDHLGTMNDAIEDMQIMLGLGEGVSIYEIPRKPTLRDILGGQMQNLFSMTGRYPMLKYQLTMP